MLVKNDDIGHLQRIHHTYPDNFHDREPVMNSTSQMAG